MASTNTDLHEYTGNCHCGAVKFRLRIPPLESAIACNCSICAMKGLRFVFPTTPDAMTMERGAENLQSYTFGKETLVHKFCRTCGTEVMTTMAADPSKFGVNIRCLQDVDHWTVKEQPFDGRAMSSTYQEPAAPDHTHVLSDDEKVYLGGCHCGAVRVAVKTQPLCTKSVTEDQCSICGRNALTMHYLPKENVQIIPSDAKLTSHRFARHIIEHRFCPTCGVQVFIDSPQEPWPTGPVWSAEDKETLARKKDRIGINTRVLRDVEWADGVVGAEGNKDTRGTVFVLRRKGDWGPAYTVA